MTRSAKLPRALLAVLAMLFLAMSFLSPGRARADDAATATGTSAAATSTDSGAPATSTESNAPVTSTETQQNAAVPPALTDPLPCTDPSQLPDCIPPCQLDAFKNLPVCNPPSSPPPPCTSLTDLPDCTPDCAFLAEVLHQDICTTLPQCLDPALLPPGFPSIPGLPVCEASSPSSPPPPPPSSGGVYYKNCADARAHGASNIHKGQPGYRPGLDRDHDGIACETSTSGGTPTTPKTPAPKPQPVADQLAYTGAVPTPVALAGFGLVLGGAGLLRLSRRPR